MGLIGILPFEAGLVSTLNRTPGNPLFPVDMLLSGLEKARQTIDKLKILAEDASQRQLHIAASCLLKTRHAMISRFAGCMSRISVAHLVQQKELIEFLIDEELLWEHDLMFAGSSLFEGLNVATVFESLDLPFYITGADGFLSCYNGAAARLWGWAPTNGTQQWCGSWKLRTLSGDDLRHDQCPMAVCIEEEAPVRNRSAIAERPDGSQFAFLPFPSPLVNAEGELVGAINVLVDISASLAAEAAMTQH